MELDRRDLLRLAGAGCVAGIIPVGAAQAGPLRPGGHGQMTGAEALVETLIQEGTDCVFGIPGAGKRAVGHVQEQTSAVPARDP